MPQIQWQKKSLNDGEISRFGCHIEEPTVDRILCNERTATIKQWVDTLESDEQTLWRCLLGEISHDESTQKLRLSKRTHQRRLQTLRNKARYELAEIYL